MKKLRDWIKSMSNRHAYWLMQAISATTFIWMLYAAWVSPVLCITIFDAVIGGLCAGNFFHNILHRQRGRAFSELVKIAEQQNEMLLEIGQIKSQEIAAEIASRMHGEVSIVPPTAPPTKH